MRARPTTLRQLALALVALVVAFGAWWAAGSVFVSPHPRRIGQEQAAEPVAYSTPAGTVRGWAFNVGLSPSCILVLHGIAADRRFSLGRARTFIEHGHGVLAIDHRGHGESDGDIVTFGGLEAEDAVAGVAWLRDQGCEKVGVDGFSMGGAAALIAGDRLKADAVVVEAVYATLEEAADVRLGWFLGPLAPIGRELLALQLPLRAGIWKSQIQPVLGASRVGAPGLVLVGERDVRAPVDAARRIAAALGGARVVVLPGAGHQDFHRDYPQEWREAVLGHFREHLGEGVFNLNMPAGGLRGLFAPLPSEPARP
jgi:pimeloyl-ACP methyl ester carboxylesterase